MRLFDGQHCDQLPRLEDALCPSAAGTSTSQVKASCFKIWIASGS